MTAAIKRPPDAGPGGGKPSAASDGLTSHCSSAPRHRPACLPHCSLSCPLTRWAWVLDDTSPNPAHWRVLYALVGLPDPLPDEQWPAMLAAVEATYAPATVWAALREAARYPTTTGWTQAGRSRAAALLATYEREVA